MKHASVHPVVIVTICLLSSFALLAPILLDAQSPSPLPLFTWPTPTPTPDASAPCEILGDVNGDGSVTLLDAVLVGQYVGDYPVTIIQACADVDCNGAIEMTDAVLIVLYAFGWIEEFPCSPTPTPTPTATPTATSTPTPTPTATPTPTPTATPTATPTTTPTPIPEPVFLEKEGDGRGSILVNDVVVCDPDCVSTQIVFMEGETYTIDALAEPGSSFDGWKLNGTPVSGLTNVFPGDTVTAIFRLEPTPTPTPTIPAPVADFVAAPVRGYAPYASG